MAGFGKITAKGEYFNQAIVNVFWYRSVDWLPLEGNPFQDSAAILNAIGAHWDVQLATCMPHDYTLRSLEMVGFDDAFNIVTSSPVVVTMGAQGSPGLTASNGAAPTAVLSLRCGPQVQINGTGKSKRNRGYLAIGPLADSAVDDYSHLVPDQVSRLEALATVISDQVTVLLPPATFIPIRIHEKYTKVGPLKILDWRTYSDILGWRINAVASYRKSRQPEA